MIDITPIQERNSALDVTRPQVGKVVPLFFPGGGGSSGARTHTRKKRTKTARLLVDVSLFDVFPEHGLNYVSETTQQRLSGNSLERFD